MNLTLRDTDILRSLRRYRFLTTKQIRYLNFPNDKDGSVTRDRLRKLESGGLASRRRAEVAVLASSTVPVWMITEHGGSALAIELDDTGYLLDGPENVRAWHSLAHWVQVSELHITIDQALAAQTRVQLRDVYFEHDVINPDAEDPSERFRLYTVVQKQPRKIICAADSAFEIEVNPYRRAFYVELERGTDSPRRAVAKKHQGFFHLNQTGLFRKHFPEAHDMRVLAVAPTASWRDALRKAMRGKPGAELWLFCAMPDINKETFLHGDVIWTVDAGPRPFVRPEGSPATGEPNGVTEQGRITEK